MKNKFVFLKYFPLSLQRNFASLLKGETMIEFNLHIDQEFGNI